MPINLLYSKLEPRHHRNYFPLILLAIALLLPAIFIGWQALKPTGSYLNPLPRGNQVAVPEGKSLSFYLGTTQESLAKARDLANSNPAQTPADKQQIITLLNQALASANQAVAAYPQDPRPYQQRAAVLFSVAHLDPSVKPLAEQDLQAAQSLAGPNPPPLPRINPLETLPLEQASLSQNVIVASPDLPAITSASTAVDSNVTKATVALPAGQSELKTDNWKLETDSIIYLIPQSPTQNHTLYIKSKTSGSFILAIDQPLNYDLTIDYWIINPDN